ncbi:hypothetical protein HA402_005304 [Bradysia odoriphaga]|nr:hypothetical protein HA402_005304 [Bradysia odoriphaga]
MSVRAIKKRENQTRSQQEKQQTPSLNQHHISNDHTHLKKRSNSYPNLSASHQNVALHISKSESQLSTLNELPATEQTFANSINAKSEICLKTLSVHHTMAAERLRESENMPNSSQQSRRMSERSSASHSPTSESQNRGFADPNNIRIPIIGYEVMEERARFTVYKLRVENPFRNDCWLVLRRYTDFVRLNNKLKSMIPSLTLTLPRKKIFGDNFGPGFLDSRAQGLQLFVNSIMGNDRLKHLQVVKDFFCLDEPPTYSESMEECRAIFEAQEETITHLKIQLNGKEQTIESLEQKLKAALLEKDIMEKAMRNSLENCSKCSKNINNILHETHTDSNRKSDLPRNNKT